MEVNTEKSQKMEISREADLSLNEVGGRELREIEYLEEQDMLTLHRRPR